MTIDETEKLRAKEVRKRMLEIRRTINRAARIMSFLTQFQLDQYEAMANEYKELEREAEEFKAKGL